MRVTEDHLTDAERARIRGELLSFMADHPMRAHVLVRIADSALLMLTRVATVFDSRAQRYALGAVAAVLLLGVGTSYAAVGALPGDLLYGFKTDVNERVASALTFGAQGRATYDAELAGVRLREAETLAARDLLTAASSRSIAQNLALLTADFNTNISTFATSSQTNVATAANIQSNLEATLSAHAHILAALSTAKPDTAESLAPIASTLDSHIASVQEAGKSIEADLSASSSASLAIEAAQTKRSALEALDGMQTIMTHLERDSGATSSVAASQAEGAKQSLDAGDTHLAHGRMQDAIHSYQSVIKAAAETETALTAAMQLTRFVPNLSLDISATADVAQSASSSAAASSTAEQYSDAPQSSDQGSAYENGSVHSGSPSPSHSSNGAYR